MKSKGIVYLIGAGPGDAGLLTLRGAELLRKAEVVVHDALVNPEILRLVPSTAKILSRGRDMSMPQAEINTILIRMAGEGKIVARLKGGDPYVFGRGAEEAQALHAANIPFEVIPGVSSISAVPNYAGIPLTHRAYCSSFTVFTGHGGSASGSTPLEYEQIVNIPGTKAVLMGTENIGSWTRELMSRGMNPDTPTALIESGTLGRQRSVSGTLKTIASLAAEKRITPPALAVLGDVVTLRDKLNWFEQRPLFGQRIAITRRSEQAAGFRTKLVEQGADVLEVPCIRIAEPTDRMRIVDSLLEINSYDWLVFTSANGVTAFFEMFFKRFKDLREIGGARIAAVGPKTAEKLRELHLQVDLMPEEYTGSKIAAAFTKYQDIDNVKICLLRAEVANQDLPSALEEEGAIVDDIPVYRTVPETGDPTGDGARLLVEGADWVAFTSASTVEHFHARFDLPKLAAKFPKMKLASIGPETSKAISTLGMSPTVESKQHTTDGITSAILKYSRS